MALVLTWVTGFAGLVYEVVWQKFLATLLGSHSEATAAVLGIFLAGLSVGYEGFGRLSRWLAERDRREDRPARLLLLYGALELAIGLYALAFPSLFAAAREVSLRGPVESASLGFAFDVALSAALIGPPAMLMGSTIPVLTQGLARSLADATRTHALVYGLNTLGAFTGALAAGFFIVPRLGLVGTMQRIGLVNLAVGVLFALGNRWAPSLPGSRSAASHAATTVAAAPGPGIASGGGFRLGSYGTAALLCGFAMMALQTVVVRVAGLALGSSPFTFSLVVAAFVLCIALGSLAVSLAPRIRPVTLVACLWAQVAMLCALYVPLPQTTYWAHVVRTLFPLEASAFYPYHLAVFAGLVALCGAPLVLSGAVLPLLFQAVRGRVDDLGERAGRLYMWNTLGSLLGALLAGYWLLFWLDLYQVYWLAASGVLAAAMLVTRRNLGTRWSRVVAAALLPALLVGLVLDPWSPELLSFGLFRNRVATSDSYRGASVLLRDRERQGTMRFYADDPVHSVAVKEYPWPGGGIVRSIVNNGKSDGSTKADYVTMALAALLPAMLANQRDRAFVIGLGTGVTSGVLASLEDVDEVVVSEISAAVIEAVPWFDFANGDASRNDKIRIVRGDAYRTLGRDRTRYDVIVSEPSNPWVAGVEMLYSREFLETARQRLAPGGVYVQWFHQYETDARAVEIVLRTFASVFPQVSVWYGVSSDLLLLGFQPPVPDARQMLERLETRYADPAVESVLGRAGIRSFVALLTRELLPLEVVNHALDPGPIHTLLHPILSDEAGRAFFVGATGPLPFSGWGEAARLGRRNSLLRLYADRFESGLSRSDRLATVLETCTHRADQCPAMVAEWRVQDPEAPELRSLLETAADEASPLHGRLDTGLVRDLEQLFTPPPGATRDGEPPPIEPEDAVEAVLEFSAYYCHAASFDQEAFRALWSRCRPEARCREIAQTLEGGFAGRPRTASRELIGAGELPPGGQAVR